MNKDKLEKWTKEQIEALIEAFKVEECLYASNLRIYRNKNLRRKALDRVCEKVSRLRPSVTKPECQSKFKNLRNQFNIENIKVKSSQANETDPDDIYKPNLWYFPLMLFLDTYVTPRKPRNCLKQRTGKSTPRNSHMVLQVSESQTQASNDMDPMELPPTLIQPKPDIHEDNSFSTFTPTPVNPAISASSNSNSQQNSSTFILPGPISPALSTSSTSGVSSDTHLKSREITRQDLTNNVFEASNNVAESGRQSATINNIHNNQLSIDPAINGLLMFIGALLQNFQDEALKLEVMNSISQTVINAKSLDLKRMK